jgi:hypothetical protein
MQIEQALYTSAQTQNSQGYHVVAASPGIDNKLAQALAVWSPSQNGLTQRDVNSESVNCFPLVGEWIGLSRTVYGGAEYSDRGEFRLETNVLVIRREQLAGYDHNPLVMARVARAAGHLRLRSTIPLQLSPIELPGEFCKTELPTTGPPADPGLIAAVLEQCFERRIVVVGCDRPIEFVAQLLATLPVSSRTRLSFTTGLKPTVHRGFAIQFLPAVNEELEKALAARDMTCVMAVA